jgi:hypothetical protein
MVSYTIFEWKGYIFAIKNPEKGENWEEGIFLHLLAITRDKYL